VTGSAGWAKEAIDAAEVVDLTKAISAIPTQADNEREVAEVIADYLDIPGIDVHIEDVVLGRANVVATVRGRGERAPLVLNGHTDAAIPDHGWSHDPYDPWVDGDRLYGAGVSDMKGGVAAMAAALKAAARAGSPPPGDVILQAVMHHDTIGLGTKFILASEGPTEGFAICGEPSELTVHTANAGALKFQVTLRGETGHISRMEGSRDAMAGAIRAYQALGELDVPHTPHPQLPDLPRMLVGELKGGIAPGAVADHVVLNGDLRTVPGMHRAEVRALLERTAAEAAGESVDVKVRILAVQKPFVGPTSGRLVDAVLGAHESVFGKQTRVNSDLPGQAFVTDAADLAHVGLETVTYGVGSWHYAPDEWISVTDLVGSAATYLAVSYDL
jgi:acetylornithine deacetylase